MCYTILEKSCIIHTFNNLLKSHNCRFTNVKVTEAEIICFKRIHLKDPLADAGDGGIKRDGKLKGIDNQVVIFN